MSFKPKVDFIAPIGKDLYSVNTGDWRYQRPVTNRRRCRRCAKCWLICPTNSRIALETHFDTDLSYCKGCALCATECDAHAIVMVEEVRD